MGIVVQNVVPGGINLTWKQEENANPGPSPDQETLKLSRGGTQQPLPLENLPGESESC